MKPSLKVESRKKLNRFGDSVDDLGGREKLGFLGGERDSGKEGGKGVDSRPVSLPGNFEMKMKYLYHPIT